MRSAELAMLAVMLMALAMASAQAPEATGTPASQRGTRSRRRFVRLATPGQGD